MTEILLLKLLAEKVMGWQTTDDPILGLCAGIEGQEEALVIPSEWNPLKYLSDAQMLLNALPEDWWWSLNKGREYVNDEMYFFGINTPEEPYSYAFGSFGTSESRAITFAVAKTIGISETDNV